MHNPLLWLGLSLFLVAVCLVAVLLVAIPVMQELARTARSAEKLLDMLSRELPPTLQSLRSTGDDLSELSGQVNEGVRSASQVVTQVDQGLDSVRSQAESVKRGSLSLFAGLRAAWEEWKTPTREFSDEYYANSGYESYADDDFAHNSEVSQPDLVGQSHSSQTSSGEQARTHKAAVSDKQALNSAASVIEDEQPASEEPVADFSSEATL